MANYIQIEGRIELISALNNTLLAPLCGNFEGAYELEDLGDVGMLRIFPDAIPTDFFKVILTSLYFRAKDPLYEGLVFNVEIPEPESDVFRMAVPAKDADKMAEDFFIYNHIENFVQLVYPLSLNSSLAKVEIIAVGLTPDELVKLGRQGKTTAVANKVQKKIEKVGDVMQTTGRIVTHNVVNPLAVASAKTTATVVTGLGKTAVDCLGAVGEEVLREAAQFSLSELKNRKDVKSMTYSLNKIFNKTKAMTANKNTSNNFEF